MWRFLKENRTDAIRLGIGVVMFIAALVLSVTIVPSRAPAGLQTVWPILIFGVTAMCIGVYVGCRDHSQELDRYGGLGALIFCAFIIGGAVGSDAGRSALDDPAYGWFLAGICASLALIGGVIGLIIPRSDVLEEMLTGI